jgi:hypothetical protein
MLVKNSSGEVLSQTLVLISILMKHAGSSSALGSETTLKLVLDVVRVHGNGTPGGMATATNGICHSVVLLLDHITTTSPDLLEIAADNGLIHFLCDWLSHVSPPPSHPPPSSLSHLAAAHTCTSLALCVLGMLGGVANIARHCEEVSLKLSLEKLNTLLLTDSNMQVVHAILRLLIPLSSLPEFRPRLYSCTLLTDLLKLPMTAITGLLLQRLMPVLELSANQIPSLVSNSYENSPPPLVDSDGNYVNGEAPLVLLGNEESTNGSIVSQMPHEVTTATSHTFCTAPNMAAGVPHMPRQIYAPHNHKVPVLHPRVLWSQKEATVLLAVQLRGCEERETTVNFSSMAVSFQLYQSTESGLPVFN